MIMQWRLSDDRNIVFDGLYSRLDAPRILTGTQAILATNEVSNGTRAQDLACRPGALGHDRLSLLEWPTAERALGEDSLLKRLLSTLQEPPCDNLAA